MLYNCSWKVPLIGWVLWFSYGLILESLLSESTVWSDKPLSYACPLSMIHFERWIKFSKRGIWFWGRGGWERLSLMHTISNYIYVELHLYVLHWVKMSFVGQTTRFYKTNITPIDIKFSFPYVLCPANIFNKYKAMVNLNLLVLATKITYGHLHVLHRTIPGIGTDELMKAGLTLPGVSARRKQIK